MADPNVQKTEEAAPAEEKLLFGKYKTMEAAEEGFNNLSSMAGNQANELGAMKQQLQFFQKQLEGAQGKQQAAPQQEAPAGPDYGKELKAIEKAMQELDSDEPDYHKQLSKLWTASNQIVSQQATQAALSAAQQELKRTLDERDSQAMYKNFYKDNPDFSTPEMQMRIDEYLAQDQSGMGDKVTAFREIQRDDARAKVAEYEQAIAEKDRLLSLKKGEEATGKVVTKGQSTQQQTKQPKVKGADLKRGMMEAFTNAA